MSNIEKAKQLLEWLITESGVTSYRIKKDTGVAETTARRLLIGESKIDNLPLGTAQKLEELAATLKEEEERMQTLEKAIHEFNEWNGAARIYYNTEDKDFSSSVYINDVDMVQTHSTAEYVTVYSKGERDQDRNIEEAQKQYILKFVEMLEDGWEPHQIEYQLQSL